MTRAEVWFDHEPGDLRGVDWILYQQRPRPVPGAQCKEFPLYGLDLTPSVEALRAQLNSVTDYEIRRARDKDKIVCEVCDPHDPAALDRFEAMHKPFAELRGLTPLDRPHMNRVAASGLLDLSVAKDPDGTALVYHANHRDARRASSQHAPSLYRRVTDNATRNLIGRASRYLLWNDIMRYKAQGLTYFDFGGWFTGDSLTARTVKINNFKQGFGGQVACHYRCEQILTLKGWVFINAAQMVEQARAWRGGSKPAREAAPLEVT